MQLFESNHYVLPTSNCVLPTAPNGALSSSMFSEALTENNSKRHFFRKTVPRYWKNRVLSFLRRRNQPYSSVVIYVSASRGWLLCCCERRLYTSDRQPRIPSPSVRLLGRANADWWILLLRRTQLWRDWIRLGWCIHRLLVIFSIVVPTQIALQMNIRIKI